MRAVFFFVRLDLVQARFASFQMLSNLDKDARLLSLFQMMHSIFVQSGKIIVIIIGSFSGQR